MNDARSGESFAPFVMSHSLRDPSAEPRTRLPLWLIAVAVVTLFIFSLSLGGLTWWLVSRSPSPNVSPGPVGTERVEIADNPPAIPAEPIAMAADEVEPGFVPLFNGHDLTGWEGEPGVWSIEPGGVIRGKTTRQESATVYSTCLFWKVKELDDFELRFSFRVMGGNNSGVIYRARQSDDFSASGYQYEILRGGVGRLIDTGKDRARRLRSPVGRTVDGWHEGAIIVSGQRIIHQLDGEILCDLVDADERAFSRGRIALEVGGGPATVKFRNVRLKENGAPAVLGK
ncbi:MAG TPA: DUF1080 domain-containing protein [Verrucomicrobiae bacterium]